MEDFDPMVRHPKHLHAPDGEGSFQNVVGDLPSAILRRHKEQTSKRHETEVLMIHDVEDSEDISGSS